MTVVLVVAAVLAGIAVLAGLLRLLDRRVNRVIEQHVAAALADDYDEAVAAAMHVAALAVPRQRGPLERQQELRR